MTHEEHRARHRMLHAALDELMADWAAHNRGKLYSESTILDLAKWSNQQQQHPTEHCKHMANPKADPLMEEADASQT